MYQQKPLLDLKAIPKSLNSPKKRKPKKPPNNIPDFPKQLPLFSDPSPEVLCFHRSPPKLKLYHNNEDTSTKITKTNVEELILCLAGETPVEEFLNQMEEWFPVYVQTLSIFYELIANTLSEIQIIRTAILNLKQGYELLGEESRYKGKSQEDLKRLKSELTKEISKLNDKLKQGLFVLKLSSQEQGSSNKYQLAYSKTGDLVEPLKIPHGWEIVPFFYINHLKFNKNFSNESKKNIISGWVIEQTNLLAYSLILFAQQNSFVTPTSFVSAVLSLRPKTKTEAEESAIVEKLCSFLPLLVCCFDFDNNGEYIFVELQDFDPRILQLCIEIWINSFEKNNYEDTWGKAVEICPKIISNWMDVYQFGRKYSSGLSKISNKKIDKLLNQVNITFTLPVGEVLKDLLYKVWRVQLQIPQWVKHNFRALIKCVPDYIDERTGDIIDDKSSLVKTGGDVDDIKTLIMLLSKEIFSQNYKTGADLSGDMPLNYFLYQLIWDIVERLELGYSGITYRITKKVQHENFLQDNLTISVERFKKALHRLIMLSFIKVNHKKQIKEALKGLNDGSIELPKVNHIKMVEIIEFVIQRKYDILNSMFDGSVRKKSLKESLDELDFRYKDYDETQQNQKPDWLDINDRIQRLLESFYQTKMEQ